MRPFVIVHKYALLVEDRRCIFVFRDRDEAAEMQQSLEYGQGQQTQVVTMDTVHPAIPQVMNLGNHADFPI